MWWAECAPVLTHSTVRAADLRSRELGSSRGELVGWPGLLGTSPDSHGIIESWNHRMVWVGRDL